MMNKIMFFVCLIISFFGQAQEKLTDLKSPASPASSIIDLNPDKILNPKSYGALETAIFSNFSGQEGNTVIPDDFALEFAPYWFGKRYFTPEEYLSPDFITQLIRTSSISVASTQNFQIGEVLTNSLGIGYRNTVFIPFAEDGEKLDKFLDTYGAKSRVKTKLISEAYRYINKTAGEFQSAIILVVNEEINNSDLIFSRNDIRKNINSRIRGLNPGDSDFIQEFTDILDEEIGTKTDYSNFEKYLENRSGVYIDLAYATSLNFPTNNFEYSYVPKQGFWLTPRISLSEKFNLLGVLRYEWFNTSYYSRYFPENNVFENNLDYGLELDLSLDRLKFNLEMVGRTSQSKIFAGTDADGNSLYYDKTDSDLQYIAGISYNLTDQIILSYNLGSKFKPVINSNQTLVSLLSLNFGFGSPDSRQIIN